MAQLDRSLTQERRLELHNKLIEVLGTSGQNPSRVYFQPPESVKMAYPAICYNKDGIRTIRANDRFYYGKQRYTVTIIDADPDSELPVKILSEFKYCSLDRTFKSDNLNHTVLTLYY